jgi:hypothetical protein
MRTRVLYFGLLAGLATIAIRMSMTRPVAAARTWDRTAAATYLDSRELWWQTWPRAQKDHGTLCISCHTNVPYAMARPGLRGELGESSAASPEQAMLASVEKRVAGWAEMVPFYSDAVHGPGKTAESRSTEAVLNAVILASVDARSGHLRAITRTAFDNAWALQETTGNLAGGWKWQDFHLGPWETSESNYQGAALLMVGAVHTPDGFAREPATAQHLEQVRSYLRRQYASQPVMNQLYILWASSKEPGLLTKPRREAVVAELRAEQEPDGGWRTTAIDRRVRLDDSPEPLESDGYATGLTVLALEDSGFNRRDPMLKRGVDWLLTHQDKDGGWNAVSLNKKRDPASDPGLFMKDAATAYAVMALEEAR